MTELKPTNVICHFLKPWKARLCAQFKLYFPYILIVMGSTLMISLYKMLMILWLRYCH